MKLNSKGTNACIKANILPEQKMRELGFTDYSKETWYYSKSLSLRDVSFNVSIPKDGSDIEIITLDENFCQPYDYQAMLEKKPDFAPARKVQEEVEELMDYLQKNNVLSGHKRGEYI